jgi:hypothetical protein
MNWPVLKALHEVYERGKTPRKDSLLKDSKVRFLLEQTRELKQGVRTIFKGEGFDKYYRNSHLENYLGYYRFLSDTGLLKPQLRFQEGDIRVLMEMHSDMESGDLLPIRDGIIEAEETVRGVSEMFFKNEKYLESSDSLVRAVKQILGIPELANDKDQQYIYILKAHKPECIVLCENLDYLKRPSRPRKHHIELWYAGGKNIEKLNYTGEITSPIYYSCDWDYDGLMIYQLVRQKIPHIRLLFPDGPRKSITVTEHQSFWRSPQDPQQFSGLNPAYYNEREKQLIMELICNDEWIIEEKNDLIAMLAAVDNSA